MHSVGTAYFLWLFGLVGICGLHRFYAGKPLSGLVWLFTLGLLGFGQLLDLLLIPGLVHRANLLSGLYGRQQVHVTVVNNISHPSDNPFDFDRPPPRRR